MKKIALGVILAGLSFGAGKGKGPVTYAQTVDAPYASVFSSIKRVGMLDFRLKQADADAGVIILYGTVSSGFCSGLGVEGVVTVDAESPERTRISIRTRTMPTNMLGCVSSAKGLQDKFVNIFWTDLKNLQ